MFSFFYYRRTRLQYTTSPNASRIPNPPILLRNQDLAATHPSSLTYLLNPTTKPPPPPQPSPIPINPPYLSNQPIIYNLPSPSTAPPYKIDQHISHHHPHPTSSPHPSPSSRAHPAKPNQQTCAFPSHSPPTTSPSHLLSRTPIPRKYSQRRVVDFSRAVVLPVGLLPKPSHYHEAPGCGMGGYMAMGRKALQIGFCGGSSFWARTWEGREGAWMVWVGGVGSERCFSRGWGVLRGWMLWHCDHRASRCDVGITAGRVTAIHPRGEAGSEMRQI